MADSDDEYGEDEFGEYAKAKPWTMNQIRDHPMFMEDVPSDISDNPELLALQSLVYDGQTPEELAEHFRKIGNDAFRMSDNKIASQNALLAYTRGLEMECKDQCLNSQLYSNRAAVSMRLKEHSKAADDCRRAIKLDPRNVKAYYRAAKASEASGLISQAAKFCAAALRVQPNEEQMQALHKRLSKQLEQEEKRRCSERRAAEAEKQKHQVIDLALKGVLEERGVTLGPYLFDVTMYRTGGEVQPRRTSDDEAVQWPLLLLYDEVSQSDFVEAFDERGTLGEQLELMFPPDRPVEWDREGKYACSRLVVYLEFYPESGASTRMLRIVVQSPLRAALGARRVPPCLVFHVLVDGTPAHESFCEANSGSLV